MDKQLDIQETVSDNHIRLWYGRLNAVYARGNLEQRLDQIPKFMGYEYGGTKEYDEIRPGSLQHACIGLMRDPSLHLYRAGKQFLYLFRHNPTVYIILSRDKEGNATYEGLSLHTSENVASFEDIVARIAWIDRKATARFCDENRRIFYKLADNYETDVGKRARQIGLSRSKYWNGRSYHNFLMRGDTGLEQAAREIAKKMGIPLSTAKKFFPDIVWRNNQIYQRSIYKPQTNLIQNY